MAQWVKNPTTVAWVTAEVQVQSPARCIAPAAAKVTAVAWNQSLAWEPPYAEGVAIKLKKKKRKKKDNTLK